MATQIVDGFSLTNRWLLYTSVMLAPAQFISGISSNCPSNIGFLAYNWYTQISWYQAVRNKELHALSLLPVHFNTLYVFSYLGGISSGNYFMAAILGLGTAGVLILNCVSAWTSWAICQDEGFGVFQFFFFGWRTLSPGWHKFILLWQVSDSIMCAIAVVASIVIAFTMVAVDEDDDLAEKATFGGLMSVSNARYPAIFLGAVVMLIIAWPLILWTELIVQRNNIESGTDMVAVYLFIAQVGTMLIPNLGCFKGRG
ncbi:fungal zn(2)-Cys(6) binuclear cluster domain-containing protein [Purpureocillium lavendulum]|uniref:Fungal zn(2)-Cys(6) binuclear cluster domain-containing protein n=1 Tax=Purpureocillium lavendulum TaxID=1247861 RepID=A0AB34FWV2_9HYPO|nr:fungal zn(2)-Cys(6) binuclear cluster domain-containing protein [Purpureocillium lavendulum]